MKGGFIMEKTKTLNILLADDQDEIHESIPKTLSSLDIDFRIVGNYYTTLEVIKFLMDKTSPKLDVLILDHDFGGNGKNGLDVLPIIRKISPKLPIIILTTFSINDADFIEARRTYHIDYIQKPVKSSDLYFRINDIISRTDEWDVLQKQIVEARKWAVRTLNITNEDIDEENIDFLDTDEWNQYQEKILAIAEKLKDYDSQKQDVNSSRYSIDNIRKKISQKYYNFSSKEIEAFTTGEYLYKVHENDNMDFSPVLISYSKGLETVLKHFLLSIGYSNSISKEMLNGLINKVQDNLDKVGYNNRLIPMIRKFQGKRNKAAHASGISKSLIKDIRGQLIDLDNRHSECILDILHYHIN